jgi:hypothetical protein
LGRLLLWGTMVLLLEACATVAGGHIPPSAFEFHEIVSQEGPEPGGWKIAQVNILLSRVSQRKPLRVWCDVEIGIPLENWKRSVTDTFAQRKASTAADAAAQFVLRGNETISAIACRDFRQEILRLLAASIHGVRVTKFMTSGIEPTSFPDE